MSSPVTAPPDTQDDFGVLREVESRVLRLSSAITHHANRVRVNSSGLKVWNAPWSLGRSVSTPADGPFWSVRLPGSRWCRKAVRTSRSRPRPSAWSGPAASPVNRRSLSTPIGLLAGMARLGRPDGSSAYVRLSTRPINQTSAAVPDAPAARERRRRQVVAGEYPLLRTDGAKVTIAAMDAVALAAPDRLARVGVPAEVVCVTSPDLLYRAVWARQGHEQAESWVLDQVFPAGRATASSVPLST